MDRLPNRHRSIVPLALGAALAGHGAADAKTEELGKVRMTGPDPIAGATAEAARAQGRALLAQNNLPQALQAFRQALAQDPDSVDGLNGIAVCYDRLGRFEDARVHYEAALGIDPTSPMLLNNYGLSLFLQGDRQGAERFLRLAAAAGDPDVQAASLRILAKIEREAAQPRSVAPVRIAATEPVPAGPRILRTSGHEQRLVFEKPRGPVPMQVASALPPEKAALVAAIGSLSANEEAGIAAAEMAAVEADEAARARADAEREARALMADARSAVPADMQVAALLKAARAAAASRDTQDEPQAPRPVAADATFGPAPSDSDWHREQILVALPGSTAGSRRTGDEAAMRMALLAAGLAPPRPAQREALAAAALAALQASGPRRTFPLQFLSDDGRLNGFAKRVQGTETEDEPTVAEKIARLEALIERMMAA